MYVIPLLSTFLSALISGVMLPRVLGARGTAVFSMLSLLMGVISSTLIWIEVVYGSSEVSVDIFGSWFEVGTFNVYWNLYFDLLTVQMLFTVTTVSLAVHSFAIIYMSNDGNLSLFMSYLSMFTFFMLVLVTGDNLIMMLVGWEGIGVCSYLLIGYWTHRLSAVKSAQKAILVNRVSDGLLLWGIISIWYYTGTLEYDLLQMTVQAHTSTYLSIAIMVGAMGKSAQILFHVWLADAMEGPTPVSALIHAATLVTAGVYVMVRLSSYWSDVVILIGSFTAIMAGIFGLFQSDIKRVIAFSTCSQLGYMFVSVGMGELGAEASMGHLLTHASFKAALFLAAGVIIMSTNGNQTMARYGGISASHCSVFCVLTLLVGSCCLVGFPETSGFYSKEIIINYAYVFFNPLSDFAHLMLVLSALITSCYTFKVFYCSFVLDFSGNLVTTSPITKNTSILIGIAFSVLLGDIVLKVWVGNNLLSGIMLFIPWGVKTLPAGLIIAGLLTATSSIGSKRFTLIRFCATRWGFDQMYASTMVNLVLDWGRVSWSIGDKGIFFMPKLSE